MFLIFPLSTITIGAYPLTTEDIAKWDAAELRRKNRPNRSK